MSRLEEREKLVKKEKNRLKKLFKTIPKEKLKAVDGLLMWIDISENGDVEMFSQSDKQEPYERERPIAKLFNSRDMSYQRIIKQLTDLIPVERENDDSENDSSDLL